MGSKYTFPPHLVLPRLNFTSSFLTFLHPPQWAVEGGRQWNSGQLKPVSLLPPSLHTFPLLQPGSFPWLCHELLQHVSFPPGKFFKNCSSVCAFHGVWSFRNRLFPHGSSMGLSPVRKTASVWVSAQTAVCVSALVWSFLACRGAACFTMVFSTGCVESVLAFEAPLLTSALTLMSAGLSLPCFSHCHCSIVLKYVITETPPMLLSPASFGLMS